MVARPAPDSLRGLPARTMAAAELTVRTEENGILVEAELVPGADHRKLAHCRARLVDPANRSVIGAAPFRYLGGSRVQAEIQEPVPPGDGWVEVVDDADPSGEQRPATPQPPGDPLGGRCAQCRPASLRPGRRRLGQAGCNCLGTLRRRLVCRT